MSVVHFIAMDTHCQTTDICVQTRAHGTRQRFRVPTTIPALREVIEQVRRPRKLVFEEGPLADWLLRNLSPSVDEALVCDPRKNALVAKDGDKDDPIDAAKLCDLFIGGFVRKVHHPGSLARQVAKQTVGLYHERVGERVRQANKVMGLLKRWGVMVREADFARPTTRAAVLERLGAAEELAAVQEHVSLLLRGYDEAVAQEKALGRQVRKLAQGDEQVQRWCALPGIGAIRGMTLLVYLDTPWRFKSKQALWKYMGIGLVRQHSGRGAEQVRVEQAANRRLKSAILGAAEQAIRLPDNPFGQQHARLLAAGLSYKNARRTVARGIGGVVWGMWKNGGEYCPEQVGCVNSRSP